jgi:glycosyltransferase involved in cell wall biosynthesis
MTSSPAHLTTPAADPLRVLFVAHSFPRHEGDGAGAFILRLAVALAERGVSVHAVAPSAPGVPLSAVLSGIPVTRFRYAPARWETLAYGGTMVDEARRTAGITMLTFLAAARRAVASAVRDQRSDVVHAHWWFPSGLAAVSAAQVPIMTTMHGTDVRIARSVPLARPALRWVLGRSAVTTTVSRWLAEEVRAIAPAAAPVVAPMPAAVELFTPGGSRDPRLILFVGRLNAQKGAKHLIRAVATMQGRTRLRVIGDGPDSTELHRQAGAQGLANRIEWLPAQPQHALVAHYRQAGIVVVPSIEEGLGMVAVEAQLCGATVVASASGGLRDVVQDGRTGRLVPPAAPEPLARALDALIADPAKTAALGAEGRRSALATFSPDVVAGRYAELYRQALDAR